MILFIAILSLVIGINFKNNIILVSSILFLIIFSLIRRKRYVVIFFSLLPFLLGLSLSYIHIHQDKEIFDGLVVESKENYFIFVSNFEKFYVYEKDNNREIGDFLSISGESKRISFTHIESSFDFQRYLEDKGVYYQINSKSIKDNFTNPIRIKATQEKFLSHFDGENRNVISSLLFSLKEDSSFIEGANNLHISRIISLSGIHIYAFMWLFNTLFSFVFKKKKYSSLAAFIFLFTFFIFTFPKISVIRIISLFIIRYINQYFLKNRLTYFDVIAFSAISLLIFDYNLARNIGFILGYLLPIFIYLLRNSFSYLKGIKKKIFIAGSIYLFFIPFEILFFNSINPLSLVLTAIFTPISIVVSIISLLIFYSIPLYNTNNFFINIFSNGISLFKNAPINIYVPNMNQVMIIIYYILLITMLYFISIRFKPLKNLMLTFYSTLMFLYCFPISNLISSEVSFINVGQGDSCLIRKGDKTILIDTGGLSYLDVAKDSLIPYLKSKRIYKIDKVILTHDDYDHSGALDNLIKNFKVYEVIDEKSSFPFSYMGIDFVNYNIFEDQYSDENSKSLVVGFKLHNVDYLVTGDALKSIENAIMNYYETLPCDILKVGHHGSNTSTSEEFIKYLMPNEAVISCGINNKYGHPHKEVISILNKYDIKIRRTDLEGTITYYKYGI